MILRRLLLALCLGLLAAYPASALSLAVKQALGPPGWVQPYQPAIQLDFARGTAWLGTGTGGGAVVPVATRVTVTRASTAMAEDLKGQWRLFPSGTLAQTDRGGFIWEARTNLALWCRDWTNAAWAKVTMTAAKTATGIDGEANAATTLTAAGASSTILQTVTQLSTADTVSMFVRRRTGTGTIEATADGLAFTDITAALAAAATATPGGWYRAVISATLVNPVLGLRITTSGDEVDVDFAQLEAGTFVTPPIATTTASVSRAADVVLITNPPSGMRAGSIFVAGTSRSTATTNAQIFQFDDGAGAVNIGFAFYQQTDSQAVFRVRANSANSFTTAFGAITSDVLWRLAGRFSSGSNAASLNGAAVVSNATAYTFTAALANMRLGVNQVGGQFLNGSLRTVALWPDNLFGNSVLRELVSR